MLDIGTKVKIKPASEIIKTLKNGRCNHVLFIEEMYNYCGKNYTIKSHHTNECYAFSEIDNTYYWLPEWFDVIQEPNDFWNDGSKEQRSLCLALYRQALSGNIPYIEKLDQDGPAFNLRKEGGFNYLNFKEDAWDEKIAHNCPDWKWLNVKPRVLERVLTILYNAYADFKILERNPNSPARWFDEIVTDAEDTRFITDFISKYLNKPINTIKYENQLQRKKSDLIRGTVPEGNIICGRKRKASVSIGHLSNKVCSGI